MDTAAQDIKVSTQAAQTSNAVTPDSTGNPQNLPQRRLFTIFRTFVRWLFISLFIGLLVGGLGIAFHFSIKLVTNLRSNLPWLLYLLPVAGVAVIGLYRFFGLRHDKGTNLCLLAVRENEPISLRQAICIFLGTVLTHLCGGSAGREGAALQIGGSVSDFIGRKLKLDEEDRRIILMCGMSACFSALFGTPVGATILALEIVNVGVLHYSALLPCIIASVSARMLAATVGVHPLTAVVALPSVTVSSVARIGLLAVVCAGLSYLFCIAIKSSGKAYRKLLPNAYLRAAVGGVLVVLVTLALRTRIYNGGGIDIIQNAFTAHAGWQEFILKLVLTALTLGAGFKGGEIIPGLFVGATFGSAAAELLALSPSVGAAVGMLAVLCGITNCPIASLFIGVELFGGGGLVFYAISVAVAYLLSGYTGLYSEQRILYSKIKPRYIDRRIGDTRSRKPKAEAAKG